VLWIRIRLNTPTRYSANCSQLALRIACSHRGEGSITVRYREQARCNSLAYLSAHFMDHNLLPLRWL